MATSFPASGIADKRVFIPAADLTGTAPTGSGAPVLAAVPDRTPSALHQAAANAGQQNPAPKTSQPVVFAGCSGTPISSTRQHAGQSVPSPKTGRESDSEDSDATSSDRDIGEQRSSVETHAIAEEVPDTTDAAMSHRNTGLLPQHDDSHEQDLAYCLGQLAIGEKVLGTDHASIATLHNNIGLLLKGQGKHEQAMEHYLKALAIKEKVLGTTQVSIATTYGNIGALLHGLDKREQALNYYLEALAIQEKVLGTSHADTVLSCGSIAMLLQEQGKHLQALQYFGKALAKPFSSNGADAAT